MTEEGCITCKIFLEFLTRSDEKCYNCKYNYNEGTENNWENNIEVLK